MSEYNDVNHKNLDVTKLDFFDASSTDQLRETFNTARANERESLTPLHKNIDMITPAIKNMRDAGIDVEIFIPENSYFQANNIVKYEEMTGAVLRIYDAEYFLANGSEEGQVLLSAHTINKSFSDRDKPCLNLKKTMGHSELAHKINLNDKEEMQDFLNTIFFSAADYAAMYEMRREVAEAQNIQTIGTSGPTTTQLSLNKPGKLSLKSSR